MRNYYAYIRVSTIKQGEKGSSLSEQRDAISRYAVKHGIHIAKWFEEQETAAKRGRTIFRRMLTDLKRGRAHGLIMHKVDRGARNLADWAELASLMDIGVDVHFAHEAIDLQTRGGRLSADIQAVVASDYIRNLREEVKKGQQGRLKAGLYPFGPMPGYQSQGGGKPKIIDPVQGPLVREAFEAYASGNFTLATLSAHMEERGLRNSAGGRMGITALSKLLATPFYCGLIRVRGVTFAGAHDPIVTKSLFDRARAQAERRIFPRTRRVNGKDFALRRMITCEACNHSLYAETQKGNTYYRCHTLACRGTSISERSVLSEVSLGIGYIHVGPMLEQTLSEFLRKKLDSQLKARERERQSAELALAKHDATLRRLTDLLVEGVIDRSEYEGRKSELYGERLRLTERIAFLSDDRLIGAQQRRFLELVNRLGFIAQNQNPTENRQTLNLAISNLSISGKTLSLQWSDAISMLADTGGSVTVHRDGTNLDNGGETSPISDEEIRARFEAGLEAIGDDLFHAIITDEKLRGWNLDSDVQPPN